MAQDIVCWTVTDGRRGIENQALGLAEAVARALETGERKLVIRRAVVGEDDFVALPSGEKPDLWIGCGRRALTPVRAHRDVFPDCFFVYVQDPRRDHKRFDLIIAPEHDRLRRPNATAMIGSPNRVSAAKLEDGATQFADRIAALPGPRAAILIGGPSKRFKLTDDIAAYLEKRIEGLLGDGLSLMITVSRRTPAKAAERLKARFASHERVWFHDGEGENPYFAFLAAADWIFVTEESTNMLVEAASTGRPVYVLPMAGRPGKFARLHAELEAAGAVRPFLGRLESWTYPPLDETARAARELIARWKSAEAGES